jgi:hypothetical protein
MSASQARKGIRDDFTPLARLAHPARADEMSSTVSILCRLSKIPGFISVDSQAQYYGRGVECGLTNWGSIGAIEQFQEKTRS